MAKKEFIEILDTDSLSDAQYKEYRYAEIDSRSGELISEGFVYGGKTFSLSSNAQLNLTGADSARADLTYPVTWNNIDDTDTLDVADATDMHNMYLQALGTKKAHLDSGTALKEQIRNAVDRAAMEAVVDNR